MEEDGKSLEGNIYIGKINDILKGMEIAFIDIGEEKKAVIHFSDILKHYSKDEFKEYIRPGKNILVQVKKNPCLNKGAKLTTDISFAGKYMVFLPNEKYITISYKLKDKLEQERLIGHVKKINPDNKGIIIRTEAYNIIFEELEKDFKNLKLKWENIEKKTKDLSKEKSNPKLIYRNEELLGKIIRNLTNKKINKIITNNKEIFLELEKINEIINEKVQIYFSNNLELPSKIEKQIEISNSKKLRSKSGAYISITRKSIE